MKRRLAWLLAAVSPAAAHVVSMSTGTATVDGRTLRYELRMPLYETQHMRDAEQAIFEHIAFSSGGAPGKLADKRCSAGGDSFVCQARYEFASQIDRLDVTCTFPELGIPAHVHLLRAVSGPNNAQAAFDASFTRSELSFRPPGAAELAARQLFSGFAGAVRSPSVLLLLAMLALACRSRRDALVIAGLLFAAQSAVCLGVPFSNWQPALRFAEGAAALAACYAAFEVLLAPASGLHWIAVAAVAALQALRFRYLMTSLDCPPGWYLGGAFLAQALLLGMLLFAAGRLRQWRDAARMLAGACIAAGLVWFAVQL